MRLFEGTIWDRPPRCEACGELEPECACPAPAPERIPPEKQTARVTIEKRKKGKVVTVIAGLAAGDELTTLLGELKSACGSGGTLKDGSLELQGNHLDRAREFLTRRGYRVKP